MLVCKLSHISYTGMNITCIPVICCIYSSHSGIRYIALSQPPSLSG
nr:MAG TPA: hypothetical protein [Bacteriophage sp.]